MTREPLHLRFVGEPVPKGAIKHIYAGGKMHGFRPTKTTNAMTDIRAQLVQQLAADWTPIEGPIHAKVIFYRGKPSSDPRRLWPTSRPDLDNYLKLLWDAFNTVAFKDDAQIVMLNAVKQFGTPGIEVVLIEMEGHAPKPAKVKKHDLA